MWNQVAIIYAVGWVTPEIIEVDIPQNKLCPLGAQVLQEQFFILVIGGRDDVDRFCSTTNFANPQTSGKSSPEFTRPKEISVTKLIGPNF